MPNAPFTRVMKMNSPEWFFIVLGCFGSIVNGGVQPAFAIIFSEILEVIKLYIVLLYFLLWILL